MRRKNLYEAPDAELLELCYEEAFLQGTNTGGNNVDDGYDDDNDLGQI